MREIAVFTRSWLVVLVLLVLLEWFLGAILLTVVIVIRLDLWGLGCHISLWRSWLRCLSRSWSTFRRDLRFNLNTWWFLKPTLGCLVLLLHVFLVHNWFLWRWKVVVYRLILFFRGKVGTFHRDSCVWRLVIVFPRLLLVHVLLLVF